MPIPAGYTSGQIIQAVVGTGKILQVVQATKADFFSTTSTSFVDITGLSVAITPSATSSKILVFVTVQASAGGGGDGIYRLVRDATAIGVGTAGTGYNGIAMAASSYQNQIFTIGLNFLDSPATTSATTYKLQLLSNTGTSYVNRRGVGDSYGGFSSITVMEISA